MLDFTKKVIIGMVHLAGPNVIEKAIEEIKIYAEEGVDACIIENYHGSKDDVIAVMEEVSKNKPNIQLGVNILPNDYKKAFEIAHKYGCSFIQMDVIAGLYVRSSKINEEEFLLTKSAYPYIKVLGGVWPKYYQPVDPSYESLKYYLEIAMFRADAIVVTGSGTGNETPLEKVKYFREVLKDYPLIVGAGIDVNNVSEQLSIANGAIIGSAFKKDKSTVNIVDRGLVKALISMKTS